MLLVMTKHLRVPVGPVVIVRGDCKSKWITAVWNNCPSDCRADFHTFCNISAKKLMTCCGLTTVVLIHTHTHTHTHTCCNTSARKLITYFELKQILKPGHNRRKLLQRADVFKTSSEQCHLNTFVWALNCIFHLYTQHKTFLKRIKHKLCQNFLTWHPLYQCYHL
jgi:hypothetical protein